MSRRRVPYSVLGLVLLALLGLPQPGGLSVKTTLASPPETPTPPPARPDSPADAPIRLASETELPLPQPNPTVQLPALKFRVENGYDLDQFHFAEAGPLNFDIDLQGFKPPRTVPARLTMRVWDIDGAGQPDWPACMVELNQVYVNGVYLADLESSGEQWSVISFAVPPHLLQTGVNHFSVEVDVLTQSCWALEMDWAELDFSFNIAQVKASALDDVSIKRGKTNQVISDPIWQTGFDSSGQLKAPASPDDPIADKSEGGVGTFRYHYQLDTWPADAKSGWTPQVEYAWEIQASDRNSGGFHPQAGWQNEFPITLPDEVGKYTLNVILKIYQGTTLLRTENRSHTLYVLLGTPVNSVTVTGNNKITVNPPKTAWLDIATDWAGNEQSVNGALQALNLREYSDGADTLGWGYGYPKVGPLTLIESGAGKKGDCYVFRDVWRILAASLGINTGSTQYHPSGRFMTSTRFALDGNSAANAWNTVSDKRDRWNFSNHQYGLYGNTFYDPTFGLIGPNTTADKEGNVFCKVNGTQNGRQVCKILGSSSAKALITATGKKLNGWSIYKYEIVNSLTTGPAITAAFLTPANADQAEMSGNFNHKGYDRDGNGLFEHLQINAEVDVLQAGNFALVASLTTPQGRLITTGSLKPGLNRAALVTEATLKKGKQLVPIYLNGYDIRASGQPAPYTINLALFNETGDMLDTADFTVAPYQPHDFQGLLLEVQQVQDHGLNPETGLGYNGLRVAAQINMLATAQVTIQGQLFAGDTFLADVTLSDKLPAGPQSINLDFPGTAIAAAGLAGPYTVYLSVNDAHYSRTISHATNPYRAADFRLPAAYFTRRTTDNIYTPQGNSLYGALNVVTEVAATVPALYTLHAVLQNRHSEFIAAAKTALSLNSTPRPAILSFAGPAINRSGADGPYQVTVALVDAQGNQLMRLNYETGEYPHAAFLPPAARFTAHFRDQGIDIDHDGFYNQLRVEVGVAVQEPNRYTLAGSLHDSQGNFITTAQTELFLNTGVHSLALNFEGAAISTEGRSGSFQLRGLTLSQATVEANLLLAHTTQAYRHTDFQPASLFINNSFADHGEDTDGNGLFEALVLEMQVRIPQRDTYYVNARLVDAAGREIEWASTRQTLAAGVQTIVLRFKGQLLYGHGVDGNYRLKDLSVYAAGQATSLADDYTTTAYRWQAFEPAGIVSGTVTINGRPVANANIFISGFARAVTDKNGSYRLVVPGGAGPYLVQIQAAAQPGPWQIQINRTVTTGASAVIPVSPGQRVTVNFAGPAGSSPTSIFLPLIKNGAKTSNR